MSYWLAFLYCFLNCHMDSMICLKQFYYFRLSHILFAMYLEHASCKEKTVLQNVLIALFSY